MVCVICNDIGKFIFIKDKPICETCTCAVAVEILRKIVEVRVK